MNKCTETNTLGKKMGSWKGKRDPSERKCLECPEHLKCPQGWKRKETAEVRNDVNGRENENTTIGNTLLYELQMV